MEVKQEKTPSFMVGMDMRHHNHGNAHHHHHQSDEETGDSNQVTTAGQVTGQQTSPRVQHSGGGRVRHHSTSTSKNSVSMETHVVTMGPGGLRNQTLEREYQGCYSVLSYTAMFVFVDVWRQLTAYGMKYYNRDVYPVAQTQVVMVAELIKLFVFLWRLVQAGKLTSIKMSPLYFMPSFIYAINSNIFFYAMHYTTPPIWNILTQLRVIFTALMYRLVFKRHISGLQWTALFMLTAAIVLPDFGDTNPEDNDSEDIVVTVVLAVAASMLTAMGPLYTEYLFKNDDRDFADMQMQLYFYGAISASLLYAVERQTSSLEPEVLENKNVVVTLIVSCTVFTALVGIATAYVMKRLDNIVKLYAQSISSMLMTVCCFFMFPKRFSLDLEFMVSLILTFVAIFLYESDNVNCERLTGCYRTGCDSLPKSGWAQAAIWLLLGGSLVVLLFLISLSQSSLVLDNVLLNAKVTTTQPPPGHKVAVLAKHLVRGGRVRPHARQPAHG